MLDPPRVSEAVLAREMVKLLLRVVWADHEVASAAALSSFARRRGLRDGDLQSVTQMLASRAPLSPPNLGLLTPRRTEVLRAVKERLLSDLHIADEKERALGEVAALLEAWPSKQCAW